MSYDREEYEIPEEWSEEELTTFMQFAHFLDKHYSPLERDTAGP